jgi:hypothetical protein
VRSGVETGSGEERVDAQGLCYFTFSDRLETIARLVGHRPAALVRNQHVRRKWGNAAPNELMTLCIGTSLFNSSTALTVGKVWDV